MAKTSVIILHYKNEKDTFDCINSFRLKSGKDREIATIIVSNSGKIGSIEEDNNLKIIVNNVNSGFSGGINIGIKTALNEGSDNLIIVNNDTIISKDSIDKLCETALSDNRIGLISPKIYFAKGYEFHKLKYKESETGKVIWYAGGLLDWNNIIATHRGLDEVDLGKYEEKIETDFTTGCMMLITKELVKDIGFFDEKYFLYYEDVDYSIRAKKKGFKVYYEPSSFIWHKNASSTDKPGSDMHVYYQTRNRMYFGFKYAPIYTKKSLFLESIRKLQGNNTQKQAIVDYYMGKMGKRK